jgi:hypothetical protein
MLRGWTAAVIVAAISGTPARVDRWVEGSAHHCICTRAPAEERHDLWRYPQIFVSSPTARRVVNDAIAADVRDSLRLKTLHRSPQCSCKSAELVSKTSDDCEPTYLSNHYISLQCSSEASLYGKSATTYRSLLFEINGSDVRRLSAEEIFRDGEAVKAVRTMLATSIQRDHEHAAEGDPNGQISEREIPELSAQMLRSAALTPGGVHFIVLGSHHSAFEATLSLRHIREFLAPGVLEELEGSGLR